MTHDAQGRAATIEPAFALARAGQFGQAEAMCRSVLSRQPDQADALLLRGLIEVKPAEPLKEPSRFAARFDNIPHGRRAHALLADASLALEQPERALESYETALRLDANLVPAIFGRANALYDLGRLREAVSGL